MPEVQVNATGSHEAKAQSGLHMHVAYLVARVSRARVTAKPCNLAYARICRTSSRRMPCRGRHADQSSNGNHHVWGTCAATLCGVIVTPWRTASIPHAWCYGLTVQLI